MESLISGYLAGALKFLRLEKAQHRYYLNPLSESDKKMNDLPHFLEFNLPVVLQVLQALETELDMRGKGRFAPRRRSGLPH